MLDLRLRSIETRDFANTDLTTLPVVEITAVLRELAAVILESIFQGEAQSDWLVNITPAQQHLLADLHLDGLAGLHHKYSTLATQQAQRGFRLRGLRRQKRVQPLVNLPEQFWPVMSQAAWSDLHLQQLLLMEIQAYFQNQVLLTLDDLPQKPLSPNTFWLLLALADFDMENLLIWFHPRRRALWRGIQQLQAIAQQQGMKAKWAGFWDQWILVQALQLWPESLWRLSHNTQQALLGLPLLALVTANDEIDLPTPPIWDRIRAGLARFHTANLRQWLIRRRAVAHVAARSKPKRNIISRFFVWLTRPRTPGMAALRQATVAAKNPAVVLTHPNWADEMPIWFERLYQKTED